MQPPEGLKVSVESGLQMSPVSTGVCSELLRPNSMISVRAVGSDRTGMRGWKRVSR